MSASWRIIEGDCRDTLASLDAVLQRESRQHRTDMVEVEPGTWRAADPADSNLTRCQDCDGELIMPECIERSGPSKGRSSRSAEPETAEPSPNPGGSS
jgi:hypothetical protein